MKQFLYFIILFSLIACGDKTSQPVESGQPAGEEHEETNIVSLTEAEMKAAGITLGSIELKNLTTSIRANGTLSVQNQNKAFITSISSGVLKTLLIQPGSYVRSGQAVATIVNPDVARLQQELQTTIAQIGMAETELKRQRELVEGHAAPLKNVQRVETELATLRASRNALSKQLTAFGISASSVSQGNIITTITIRAPISGTISNVSAQIGSPVDPNTPIAEIVNNSQLHLDLFVYEKDLPRLQPGQVIHFTLTNNPGKEYDARIYSIGTAFVSETKSIPVHAVVQGDKTGLIEGMSITALISIGENVVPAVPAEAIVSQQGQDFIFIKTEAPEETVPAGQHNEAGHQDEAHEAEGPLHYFEKLPVVKGASDVGYTEITLLKPLPRETQVIVKGAFFVMAKMSDTGEHHH